MRSPIALLLLASATSATGCGATSTATETQIATLGTLSFELPVDWTRAANTTANGSTTEVWTPRAEDNRRKESVSIIRGELRLGGMPSAPRLDQLLAGAQGSLRGAKVSKVSPLRTERGLSGARIDVSYQPGVGAQRYRRVHVVLRDAETAALVHVLYTAVDREEGEDTLRLVLDSLHREES